MKKKPDKLPSSPGVSVGQWLEHPTDVREVVGSIPTWNSEIFSVIDFLSLYVLFSHFRPRDVLMGIFLLSFYKLCVHLHVHKTTLERNYSLE